ncbi:MAG: 3-hydroxyacyl-ACP dehydratase FabZ [Legionellales bacterium]|nr:3-hydroxyacyl-ACP dehydratase FabZ [Legionellales bacterium]
MTILNIQEVMQLLPHRYPFLLVDRVLDYKLHESITAIKNVTINEHFFAGHFPQRPVMPGVLILEAMAQTAGILAFLSTGGEPTSDEIYYFAAIDNARFKRVVEPGDQLRMEVKILKIRRDVIKAEAIATVDGEVVCSATLMSVKKGTKS